jgi:hypothetical protein
MIEINYYNVSVEENVAHDLFLMPEEVLTVLHGTPDCPKSVSEL